MNKAEVQFNLSVQAHIFTGSKDNLLDHTYDILQKVFCKKNKCGICVTCQQIIQQSSPNIFWVKPEKQYTLDQIDTVLHTVSFNLDNQQLFFVVFPQAHLLTLSCSNRLLKTIEEPPKGYYFIFLTSLPKLLLPTIISRCVVSKFDNGEDETNLETSDIGKFFIVSNPDAVEFLKTVEKSGITEHESLELLNSIMDHWSGKIKRSVLLNKEIEYKKMATLINLFNNNLATQLMPGSSKIFWKNLFLQYINLF